MRVFGINRSQNVLVIILCFLCLSKITKPQPTSACVPGWNGTILIDCENNNGWSVEVSSGSSGTIISVPGFIGNAIQLNWSIGTGDWVQAKYTFSQPIDLSKKDIFGLSLKGSTSDLKNVDLMFADVNNVFYGAHFEGINNIISWMKNLTLPKKLFYWYFQIRPDTIPLSIDWSQINRFFVVVKRPPTLNPLVKTGQLTIDHLQADRAAAWERQQQFEQITYQDTTARNKAVQYILNQQRITGLCLSWKEEPSPKAWLYDQALALIVLTHEGMWFNGVPQNQPALSAQAMVNFITAKQKIDGHWPRGWNPDSGTELADDLWVGDQAWWIIALTQFAEKAGDANSLISAQNGAQWLSSRINQNGSLVPSTEGNVDAWWAFISTDLFAEANSLQSYLMNKVWDSEMRYWWRGLINDSIPDPVIAMDCATWMSEFAKSKYVQRPDMALDALRFIRRTLITTDTGESNCGFDGMGPLSIWCEGTAQYIACGGEGAEQFLAELLSLQREDGGMPGSTDSLGSNAFGWLSNWTGLSSTAWLYFALTRSPFPNDSVTAVEPSYNFPLGFKLYQNFPNPFNPNTTINYSIPRETYVTIRLYDVLGNEILTLVDEIKQAGTYQLDLQTNNLTSGSYFYQMKAGEFLMTKKLVLLR